MGFVLHSRPNGSVSDPVDVDEAPLVPDVKAVAPVLELKTPLVLDAKEASSLHEPNDASLVLDTKEALPLLELKIPLVLDAEEALSLHEPQVSLVPEAEGILPMDELNVPSVLDAEEPPLLDVPKERDPHVVPTFTAESVANPTSAVLYLPPLLSSLPKNVSVPPVSMDRPPLVTETRLPDIDPVSLSLHKALHHFRPVSEDYAALAYALAFNWAELDLPEDEEREWYAVAFRSRRKKGSDSGPLYEADRKAHEEAVSNGGLIMYWYGVPNPDTGMNLATCIWQSRKHAIAANSRPHHIRAMRLAAASYEVYALERYRLTKTKGGKGILVEDFSGEDCGW